MKRIPWLPQFQIPRRSHLDQGVLRLRYRRIYILPTRNGLSFGVVLAIMLLGSMNYSLSLGYLLTFLLGGMATASILHTFRNLLGLTLRTGRTLPDFCGGQLGYTLLLESGDGRPRTAIEFSSADDILHIIDVPAQCTAELIVNCPAQRRGLQALGNITVATRYPLGLFRAWSPIEFEHTCPVWPRPDHLGSQPPFVASQSGGGHSIENVSGFDDFSGLRQYHSGDSLRHVAWKAVAREQGLMTKQFSGLGNQSIWFDWAQLDGIDPEQRLSTLCRWIIDADRDDQEYGLRLPGIELPPNVGIAHRTACLNALATFDTPPPRENAAQGTSD
ncbi:MAG: DUF58 domain-containing protein [Gammaproteobacteria bacterium]|nr:DUF58 domain-containing protein [Gammaproteobacteria bacterium]